MLTKDQVKDKIRDVLANEDDDDASRSEALMTLVIIPIMESTGQKPPYSFIGRVSDLFNNAMAEVLDELGV